MWRKKNSKAPHIATWRNVAQLYEPQFATLNHKKCGTSGSTWPHLAPSGDFITNRVFPQQYYLYKYAETGTLKWLIRECTFPITLNADP